LKIAGYALRIRWEWLRRTRPELSWCALPRRPERAAHAMFQASVSMVVGDGRSAKFWTDSWLPDGPICRFAPHLFNAVAKRKRDKSVRKPSPTGVGFVTFGVRQSLTSCATTLLYGTRSVASFSMTWPRTGSYGDGPRTAPTPRPFLTEPFSLEWLRYRELRSSGRLRHLTSASSSTGF
jgi:hypothetical protein